MKHNKESLRKALLNNDYDLDEVVFKFEGYDFDLKYSCDTGFQEGANGGTYYTIHIERIKIEDEISSLFADSKEEAVQEVMEQLDYLLNIDNNKHINERIKRYEDIITNLKTKLETSNEVNEK